MGYQPLERLLPKANNSIYKLILMASQRATELADGKPPLIEGPLSPKATSIAFDEIAAGKVVLKVVADQFKPPATAQAAAKAAVAGAQKSGAQHEEPGEDAA